jgi:hypothetical protein
MRFVNETPTVTLDKCVQKVIKPNDIHLFVTAM